jgi:hypothetical protein
VEDLTYSITEYGTYNSATTFKDAGYYKFKASMDNPNYSFATVTKTIRMHKADIGLYFLNSTVEYNTNTHFISAGTSSTIVNTAAYIPAGSNKTPVTLLGSDIATVTYVYTTDSTGFAYAGQWNPFTGAVNAGTYYIKASILAADITGGYLNYNVWSDKEAVLLINQATITGISLTGGGTYTYNGAERTVAANTNQSQFNETLPIVYTMSPKDIALVYDATHLENRAKSAGYYVITAVINDVTHAGYDPNYKKLQLSSSLTIEKAVMYNTDASGVLFYFTTETMTYDGRIAYLNIIRSSSGTSLSSGVTATQVLETAISPSNATSYVGDMAAIEYWYTQTSGGPYSTAFVGAKNSGVYYIKAKLTNSNYITQEYESTLTINPYNATVVWTGFDGSYTYNGLNQTDSISAHYALVEADVIDDNFVKNLDLSITWCATQDGVYAAILTFMRAGYYKVSVTSDNPNYNFIHGSPPQALEKPLVMAKAYVNRYMVDNTVTYDGFTHYISLGTSKVNPNDSMVTTAILLGSDTVQYSYKYKTDPSELVEYIDTFTGKLDAGTYYIKATLQIASNSHGGPDNYYVWPDASNDETNTATLTISRRELTVTPTVSWTKVYDSTTAAPAFTVSNFVTLNEQGVNESTTHQVAGNYNNKNVGVDKTIIFSVTHNAGGGVCNNYFITNITTGVITKHTLIATTPGGGWTMAYTGTNYFGAITIFEETPDFHGIYPGDNLVVLAYFNSKNVSAADTITFNLSGADLQNYAMSSITTGVSITKKATTAYWSNTELVYNGYIRESTAYFNLVGNDRTLANGGTADLDVTFYADTAHTIVISEYRNAGTYYALAQIDVLAVDEGGEPYVNNYTIEVANESMTCTIAPIVVSITWSGLDAGYVYQGIDFLSDISATITVVGTDPSVVGSATAELTFKVLKNGEEVTEIRNAGVYTITASLDYTYPSTSINMSINYDLSNNDKEVTVEKADITNIVFGDGTAAIEDSFEYSDGTPRRYFVTTSISGVLYSSALVQIAYQYDSTINMTVTYSGGDIGSVGVTGNNGVKNVGTGSYTITASIIATQNYNAWSGAVQVEVSKGDITYDFFYKDNIVTYKGQYVNMVVTNSLEEPNLVDSVDIYYRDGSFATAQYKYLVPSISGGFVVIEDVVTVYDAELHDGLTRYAYVAFTSQTARNAQKYYILAEIVETANYLDWSKEAILTIEPKISSVKWEFNNVAIAQAEAIMYNGYDQFDSVGAFIDAVGSDGTAGRIDLYIDPNLFISQDTQSYTYSPTINDYTFNGGLSKEFRLAGTYDAVAAFNVNDIGSPRYYSTNYVLTEPTREMVMNKYGLDITWYQAGTSTLYDPLDPYVYDGEQHGVTPVVEGLYLAPASTTYYSDILLGTSAGTLTVSRIVSPTTVDGVGLFIGDGVQGTNKTRYYVSLADCSKLSIPVVLSLASQVNAGQYIAEVVRIKGGVISEINDPDAWSGGSVGAGYLYDYNYVLPSVAQVGSLRRLNWEILKRQLGIVLTDTSDLFKYYNGSNILEVSSTETTYTVANELGIDVRTETHTTSAGDGSFEWEVSNIVNGDQTGIALSFANIQSLFRAAGEDDVLEASVKANLIKILFNVFSHINYYVDDIEAEQENLSYEVYRASSTPADPKVVLRRPISIAKSIVATHMYNGTGVNMMYNSAANIRTLNDAVLFGAILDLIIDTNINELYEGNYFVGQAYIQGLDPLGNSVSGVNAKDAGDYTIYIVPGLTTADANGYVNYDVSIATSPADGLYRILPRELKVIYTNSVQSLETARAVAGRKPLGIYSIELPSDTVDITAAQLQTILTSDGMGTSSFRIENNWISESVNLTGARYTMFVGSTEVTEERIYITIDDIVNGNNYEYNVPVLQLTSVGLANPALSISDYKFIVNDSSDIINLGSDINGLTRAKFEYGEGEGIKLTYTQTNDVYAITSGGGYGNYNTPSSFDGLYNGQGYSIYDLSISGNLDTGHVGMFGELAGEVRNLHLRRASITAVNFTTVGAIAGRVSATGIIKDSSFHGTIVASSETSLAIGAIAGKITGGTMENITAVGYLYVNAGTGLYAGGGIGVVSDDISGKAPLINGINSFVEIAATSGMGAVTKVSGLAADIAANIGINVAVTGISFYEDQDCTISAGTLQFEKNIMKVAGNTSYSFVGDGIDGEEDVVYYVKGNNASKNVYLNNAIMLDGIIVQEEHVQTAGLGKDYDSMIADSESVLTIVNNYVYKNCYVGTVNDGSALKPFNISVHNQLALIEAYSWASFKLSRDIIIPISYEPESLTGWYYGDGINTNENKIYSPNIQITMKLINVSTISLESLPDIVYGQYPQGS